MPSWCLVQEPTITPTTEQARNMLEERLAWAWTLFTPHHARQHEGLFLWAGEGVWLEEAIWFAKWCDAQVSSSGGFGHLWSCAGCLDRMSCTSDSTPCGLAKLRTSQGLERNHHLQRHDPHSRPLWGRSSTGRRDRFTSAGACNLLEPDASVLSKPTPSPGIKLGFENPVFFERHAVGGEYGASWKALRCTADCS